MKINKIIIVMLLLSLVAIAQENKVWQNYTCYTDVQKITATKNGIWAATSGGAFFYNREDSTFITLNKVKGLSSHQITTVAVDKYNRVWFGDYFGNINVYNQENKSISKILDIASSDKPLKEINDIKISNDTVFVATSFGISLIDVNSLSFIETAFKLGNFTSGINVNSILKIDGVIYVCTNEGLAIQKKGSKNISAPENWSNITIPGNPIVNDVLNISDTLYIASNRGLFFIEKNSSKIETLEEFESKDVRCLKSRYKKLYGIAEGKVFFRADEKVITLFNHFRYKVRDFEFSNKYNYDLLIATDKGLVNFVEYKINIIKPNSPVSNSFVNIEVDSKGNLWGGTGKNASGKGVTFFNGTEWENFNKENSEEITSNDFHNIYIAPNDDAYFLSWGFGFTKFANNKLETFNSSNTQISAIPGSNKFIVIADAVADNANNLWFLNYWAGNTNVLSLLTNKGDWHHYKFTSPLYPKIINTDKIIIDSYGNKWFTSTAEEKEVSDQGLYRFNENGTFKNTSDDIWNKYTTSNSLESNLVTALALDRYDDIWVGTTGGLNYITNTGNNNVIIRKATNAGRIFRTNLINCIKVDAINNKWIGTNNGIFYMNSDCTKLIDQFNLENSPLPNNNVKSIAIDNKRGIIYFGTEFGLTSLQTSISKPKVSFTKLKTYPSPFIIGEGKNLLKIEGLVKNTIIKIFSISGNLIREIVTPGGGIGFWNGRNSDGSLVSSGVYIITAFDDEVDNVITSKIAVIRK